MRGVWRVLFQTGRAFYDDQMTQHASALTYYGLMSLFPSLLLGISLLGLLGQYPETYNSIVAYLRDVVPKETLGAIDHSLRGAIKHKSTAATALAFGTVTALYGATGALESARRALNVVFGVQSGRSFLRRKARDIVSSIVLMGLVLLTVTLMFVGGTLADHAFGENVAHVWNLARWPLAVLVAMFVFAYIYHVTPDADHAAFHLMTPGAVVGVLAWIVVSWGFSQYLNHFGDVSAIYGTFAGAIVLVVWVWLTNCALLFGAELNAAMQGTGSASRQVAVAGADDDRAVPPQVAH